MVYNNLCVWSFHIFKSTSWLHCRIKIIELFQKNRKYQRKFSINFHLIRIQYKIGHAIFQAPQFSKTILTHNLNGDRTSGYFSFLIILLSTKIALLNLDQWTFWHKMRLHYSDAAECSPHSLHVGIVKAFGSLCTHVTHTHTQAEIGENKSN